MSTFVLSACGPDLKLAKQAYDRKDYPSAISQWTALSEFGIPEAHLSLARAYAEGKATEIDLPRSLELMDRAEKDGASIGRREYQIKAVVGTSLLRYGNKDEKQIGLAYLQEGLEAQHPRATFEIARAYEEGYGVPKSAKKAIEHYQAAARLNYSRAIFYHGRMYVRGRVVGKNHTRALELYTQAYESGYTRAALEIGHMYKKGLGTSVDLERAAYYYGKAADAGIDGALENLEKITG